MLKLCKVCRKEFIPTGNHVTCSKLCSLENRRRSKRDSWLRHKPDRYFENLRLKYWRISKRVEKKYAKDL